MQQNIKKYLWLIAGSISFAQAYIPTTWINEVPNNLYAPPCLTSKDKANKTKNLLQADANVNFFLLAQWSNSLYGQHQAGGFSVQGRVRANRLLPGIYGQINTAIVMNHEKSYDSKNQRLRYNELISLADTHCLIGWNAINKKRFQLSGYALGIIPATKHAILNSGRVISWVGLDNHFAWGLGIESSLQLLQTERHHLDWLIDSNMTFLENRKGIAWVNNNGIYEPQEIKIDSNQLYKISSTLAYNYKRFLSDIGVQLFYMPSLKYSSLKNTPIKRTLEPKTWWNTLFGDIGLLTHVRKLEAYGTIGGQVTAYEHLLNWDNRPFDSWGINLKLGLIF